MGSEPACGAISGDGRSEDCPSLCLHRSSVLCRTDPQLGLDVVVEIADDQTCHGVSSDSTASCNDITIGHRSRDARIAYDEAVLLTENAAERDLLTGRLQQLDR